MSYVSKKFIQQISEINRNTQINNQNNLAAKHSYPEVRSNSKNGHLQINKMSKKLDSGNGKKILFQKMEKPLQPAYFFPAAIRRQRNQDSITQDNTDLAKRIMNIEKSRGRYNRDRFLNDYERSVSHLIPPTYLKRFKQQMKNADL